MDKVLNGIRIDACDCMEQDGVYWHALLIGEFGAQASRDIVWANRRYRCARGGGVVLSDLTDQNSDSPAIQNLRARQMPDKMSDLILVDSGVDPSRN